MANQNKIVTVDRIVDNAEPIGATLLDNDGTAIDLTGRTVTFDMYDMADGTQIVTDGSVTVITAASGTVKYTPASGDVDTVGLYAMYFTDDTGRQWPYDGARYRLNIVATTTPTD